MTPQLSREQYLRNLTDSGILTPEEVDSALRPALAAAVQDGEAVAQQLIAAGTLTRFQAEAVRDRRFDELVIEHYQVLDRLGSGGMGTVYRARHRRMKRVVAIKVLARTASRTESFVQRFQREVEAVARLSHPNIVMAHDAGEAEVGHYLVMEFVDGRDLTSEVQARGPLPIAEAVDCIVQAARGLGYAHGQGVIHRDIKPANLMRDLSGVVKVADLGLARFSDALSKPADDAGSLTQAGTIMGTVDYMPPEQAMGLSGIDHRADIYSLGCSLYFLLTGRPPFQGPTLMATLLMHRDAPTPSLTAARADVPPALDRAFQRMLAKKPDDRFASMAEVVQALEAIAASTAPVSPAAPGAAATISGLVSDTAAVGGQTVDLSHAVAPPCEAVLLVEPSRSQAVIIRSYLNKLGRQEIHTAPSGRKALEMARTTTPQIVVSAMHLPDMTGVQLAQALRGAGLPTSPGFVLITSQDDARELHLHDSAGDLVCLHKPFGQEQLGQALASAASGSAAASERRVLLVDDSAAARAHVRGVLAGLGLRLVVEVADGAAAVALLEKETFDLVVTDYNMPRLDGRGLLEFIRRRSAIPSVPVIMVTTETDPGKLAAVRQLGITAICAKSFEPATVRGILDTIR